MLPCVLRLCAVAILTASLPHAGYPQGPIQPPGGPAPTMKTLDQLHDRIEIAEERLERRIPLSSFPVTIIRPGSYYLIGSPTFSATSGNAITVTVSDVTIDLMGFTLRSEPGVLGDAIHINGNLRNIAVKNGAISGTTTVSVTGLFPQRSWSSAPGGFRYGIDVGSGTTNCEFSRLRISGCRSGGLRAGNGSTIDHVSVSHTGGKGIEGGSCTISKATARLNMGQGINASSGGVAHSTAEDNREDGIAAHAIDHCVSNGNGESGLAGNVITHSSVSSNDLEGISASQGTVTNCNVKLSGSDGILAPNGVVAFCRVSSSNARNNGSVNIDGGGTAVLTGNNANP